MEGIVALSVACNVFQLVSYGLRTIALARQYYENGTTDNQARLQTGSSQLYDVSQQLESRLGDLSTKTTLSHGELELQRLSNKAQQIAERISAKLNSTSATGRQTGLAKKLRLILKSVLSQRSLKEWEASLQQCRDQLQFGLISELHLQQTAIYVQSSGRMDEMDRNLQEMVIRLAQGFNQLEDLVIETRDGIKNHVQKQSEMTRVHVSEEITKTAVHAKFKLQSDKLLASLKFESMNLRLNSVAKAYTGTFDWIFRSDGNKQWDSFASWLENGEGLYWISGKPASGKSTLIKLIVEDPKAKELLQKWAGDNAYVALSYFLWKGGQEMQRSVKGLLCSLVYQILDVQEEFLVSLRKDAEISKKEFPSDWSIHELLQTVAKFANTSSSKICIFLDGLDEADDIDGDYGIFHIVRQFQNMPGTKICLGSRPEVDFLITYGSGEYPMLRLQDLTQKDIYTYVLDQLKLIERQHLSSELPTDQALERIVQTVLDKADGVFLWVKLATIAVTRGLRRLERWEDLLVRLEGLPSELEDLYTDMWTRSLREPDASHRDAARYFRKLLSKSEDRMTLFKLMFDESQLVQPFLLRDENVTTVAQFAQECKRIQHKILGCSMGLLELYPNLHLGGTISRASLTVPLEPKDSPQQQLFEARRTQVLFIYRTAVDFLTQTILGRELMSRAVQDVGPSRRFVLGGCLLAGYCESPLVDLHYLIRGITKILFVVEHDAKEEGAFLMADRVLDRFIRRGTNCGDIIRDLLDNCPDKGPHQKDFNWLRIHVTHYAIGWRGLIAQRGGYRYFQSYLRRQGAPVDSQFLGLLALCAATGISRVYHEQNFWRLMSAALRSISLFVDRGAALNIVHPVKTGSRLLTQPLATLFLNFAGMRIVPTTNTEKEEVLSYLIRLLHNVKVSLAPRYVLLFTFRWTLDGIINEEEIFDLRLRCESFDFAPSHESILDREWGLPPHGLACLIEINLSGILLLFCRQTGIPFEQQRLLQDGHPEPWQKLLATVVRPEESLLEESHASNWRRWKSPPSRISNTKFNQLFDQSMAFPDFFLQKDLSSHSKPVGDLWTELEAARNALWSHLTTLYAEGTECDYDEIVNSHGMRAARPVTLKDIVPVGPQGSLDGRHTDIDWKDRSITCSCASAEDTNSG